MDIFISNVTAMKCNNMHVREMLLDRIICSEMRKLLALRKNI